MQNGKLSIRILTLVVLGFVVFCGGLVIQSGFFKNSLQNKQGPILLQSTTTETPPQSDAEPATQSPPPQPQPKRQQLEKVDTITFGADNAPAKIITLGSVDPKNGYKYQLELTSKGAAIRTATFSGFNNREYKNPQPLVLLSPIIEKDGSEVFSMANNAFKFDKYKVQLALNRLNWKSSDVETSADGSQTAQFEAIIKNVDTNEPVIKLIKTYKVIPDSYLSDCNITVENLSASEQEVSFKLTGPVGIEREGFRSDMRRVIGGFLTSQGQIVSSENPIITSFGNTIRKKLGLESKLGLKEASRINSIEDLTIGSTLPNNYRGSAFLWAAITNKYFAAILRPVPQEGKSSNWIAQKLGRFYNPNGDERGISGDESIGIELGIAPTTLEQAGQTDSTKEYDFQLFMGPKDRDLFYKNLLYKTLGFAHTITFTSCCCCPAAIIRPIAFGILGLMKWMYGFIPNYGVVIIILVFLMRLIMHPITKKSQVSMSRMSQLAPRAEQIKKKYANNKTEMNKRLMELYKEQGASPIMGFLPMLIQMPIWIALWSSVYTSVDLRGAPFLPFWITDLSMPDALFRFPAVTLPLLGKLDSFNLLPILMGVAFYLQQKLMPTQTDTSMNPQMAQQQRMMKIMMPLMFPLILYKGPSGVNLYIMASTFAGVIEQYVIRKHIREKEQAEAKGLVPTTKKTGGKAKKKKPKPFFKI
jgi:YidC/Oxa1 family membrane protein insertase